MLNKFFSNKGIVFFLFLIIILGAFFRFYKNTENPSSLNIDEVSIGYNAYSILKTGKDEYGKVLPISFESVGDFKPSGLIYLTVPSVWLFGLNEFAVRFPTALLSTLSIIVMFFLTLNLTKSKRISLISTFILAISPWHIYYSRYASEAVVALFFLMAGILFLLRFFEKTKDISLIFSAICLSYSMYTYHPQRIFVPLFVVVIFLLKRNEVKRNFKKIFFFIVCCVIFCLPLVYSILFASAGARLQMTFVANDIEFTRPILAGSEQNKYVLLVFYVIRKYLNYFSSPFAFYNALTMTPVGVLGLGVIHIFELPFLIFALVALWRKKIENNTLIIIWIVLGIFPAALTQNEQHPLRTLLILPAVIILLSYGAKYFFEWINGLKKVIKFGVLSLFLITVLWGGIHAIVVFSYYFPYYKDEAFMAGTKEAVLYAIENKADFEEIIFDPVRGIEGPYIVSVPHMYFLFYSAYDPLTYQNMQKRYGEESYGFDKFTIRSIYWPKDRGSINRLYIGSPWSLPEKDVLEANILKKVYLSNGKLAFLIVKSEK